MIFLNPIYLWCLLGIMIPVAIHLWSRRKVIKIRVGSTQLLRESIPKHKSTIRLNELWLLFLRILTIALLALIISEPQVKWATKNSPLLYIVEPSLITSPKLQDFFEDLPEESIRLLLRDFPGISQYDNHEINNYVPNYWQLAQDMGMVQADSIVVLANGFLSGIKGKRPTIPNHINWTVINTDNTSKALLEAKRIEDSLELLTINSDFEKLRFEKRNIHQNDSELSFNVNKDTVRINGNDFPIESDVPINVLIVSNDSLRKEQEYISSAYSAVSDFLNVPITIKKTLSIDSIDVTSYDVSIWLGVEPIDDLKKTRLLFKSDSLSNRLIVPGNTKNEYFLTKFLTSENSVRGRLTEELYVLLNLYESLEKEIALHDKRVISVEELRPVGLGGQKALNRAHLINITPWLWGVCLLVLVSERILAKYRKQ